MNKTKIEWCDYTWNPVVGCMHGCSYCYARQLNNRFKWLKDWNEPKFFPERMDDPIKLKKPSTIFVGSMCDLFGNWVPDEWIMEIISITDIADQHQYMFLTKNPSKYLKYIDDFKGNCWLGVTVEHSENIVQTTRMAIMSAYSTLQQKTFISIEPIMGGFEGIPLSFFDMVIVGAMTGKNVVEPKQEWIESINHHNILWKNNIKKYLK